MSACLFRIIQKIFASTLLHIITTRKAAIKFCSKTITCVALHAANLGFAEAVGPSLGMTTTSEESSSTPPNPKAVEVFLEEFQPALDAMTATDPPPPLVDFGAVYVALSHP